MFKKMLFVLSLNVLSLYGMDNGDETARKFDVIQKFMETQQQHNEASLNTFAALSRSTTSLSRSKTTLCDSNAGLVQAMMALDKKITDANLTIFGLKQRIEEIENKVGLKSKICDPSEVSNESASHEKA